MTDDTMALRTLLEKSPDADFLREMIGFGAERLMQLEVQGLTGAAHGERSPERINSRNGFRDRIWVRPQPIDATHSLNRSAGVCRNSPRSCMRPRPTSSPT
jgi:hypothetical protein